MANDDVDNFLDECEVPVIFEAFMEEHAKLASGWRGMIVMCEHMERHGNKYCIDYAQEIRNGLEQIVNGRATNAAR